MFMLGLSQANQPDMFGCERFRRDRQDMRRSLHDDDPQPQTSYGELESFHIAFISARMMICDKCAQCSCKFSTSDSYDSYVQEMS